MSTHDRIAFRAAVDAEKFRIRVNTEALIQIAAEDAKDAAWEAAHDAAVVGA